MCSNIEKYIDLCNKGKTKKEISNELNVTIRTVTNYKNKTGISPAIQRRVNLNQDYFKSIDCEEKAYILGFICADGYIDTCEKTLCFGINKKDAEILFRFRDMLQSKAELTKHSTKNCVRINFCSKVLVDDLKKIGITRNKTKTLEMPIIKDNLMNHFIRGYIDGDGHIGVRQCVIVCGSENFKNSLVEYLESTFRRTISVSKVNNHYRIVLNRRDYDIIDWIYKNQTISLSRKYKSYTDNWATYSEKRRSRG